MLVIIRHAIERYQERVSNVPDDQVIEALRCKAVQLADAVGAPFVRLGGGQRVVIQNHAVVTVLPIGQSVHRLGRRRQ